MAQWDSRSAIRERLALLAALGPAELDAAAHEWAYDSHGDWWTHERFDENQLAIRVGQEAVESLAIIERKWWLGRKLALEFIGYPEVQS